MVMGIILKKKNQCSLNQGSTKDKWSWNISLAKKWIPVQGTQGWSEKITVLEQNLKECWKRRSYVNGKWCCYLDSHLLVWTKPNQSKNPSDVSTWWWLGYTERVLCTALGVHL